MKHCVYILYSEKLDRFYIGETSNFDSRMEFHNNSDVKKFTGKAKDWELFLKFDCECKAQALSIEKHIKRMKSRVYINNFMKYPEIFIKLKSKYPY